MEGKDILIPIDKQRRVHSKGEKRKLIIFFVPLLKSEDKAQAVIKGANYTLKFHYPSL